MTVPMEKLDPLVAGHLEDRLLDPTRLEEVLATVLDRRQERTERRPDHIAELNKRATETDLRLKRLYDAIESGVADLDDPDLKDRIASLKATRDQSRVDADRASAMLESAGQKAITAPMLAKFAQTTRQRIRLVGGGYRRDHLRALAQRVEVNDGEVRIMGSKSDLLRTLAAADGGTAAGAVPIFVPRWRKGGLPVFQRNPLFRLAVLFDFRRQPHNRSHRTYGLSMSARPRPGLTVRIMRRATVQVSGSTWRPAIAFKL